MFFFRVWNWIEDSSATLNNYISSYLPLPDDRWHWRGSVPLKYKHKPSENQVVNNINPKHQYYKEKEENYNFNAYNEASINNEDQYRHQNIEKDIDKKPSTEISWEQYAYGLTSKPNNNNNLLENPDKLEDKSSVRISNELNFNSKKFSYSSHDTKNHSYYGTTNKDLHESYDDLGYNGIISHNHLDYYSNALQDSYENSLSDLALTQNSQQVPLSKNRRIHQRTNNRYKSIEYIDPPSSVKPSASYVANSSNWKSIESFDKPSTNFTTWGSVEDSGRHYANNSSLVWDLDEHSNSPYSSFTAWNSIEPFPPASLWDSNHIANTREFLEVSGRQILIGSTPMRVPQFDYLCLPPLSHTFHCVSCSAKLLCAGDEAFSTTCNYPTVSFYMFIIKGNTCNYPTVSFLYVHN